MLTFANVLWKLYVANIRWIIFLRKKKENAFCAMKRKKDAPLNAKIKRHNEIEFICDHKNFYCYSCGINENKYPLTWPLFVTFEGLDKGSITSQKIRPNYGPLYYCTSWLVKINMTYIFVVVIFHNLTNPYLIKKFFW